MGDILRQLFPQQQPQQAAPTLQELMTPEELSALGKGSPSAQFRPAQGIMDWLTHAGQMAQYGIPHTGFGMLGGAGQAIKAGLPATTAAGEAEKALPVATAAKELGVTPDVSKQMTAWLKQVAAKQEQESAGRAILEDLEIAGKGPGDVAKTFWKTTYPQMNAKGKAFFEQYITKQTGFKLGDVLGAEANGDPWIARSWEDIYPVSDLPEEMGHLQGTERGLIALMAEANKRGGKLPQVE